MTKIKSNIETESFDIYEKLREYDKALSKIANEDLDYIRKQPFAIKEIARKVLEKDK